MSVLLLVFAVICWLIAGIPGFIQVAVGRVDWGWLGLFFFGVWLLVAGAGQLLALVRRG
jgi:hypothetical protein